MKSASETNSLDENCRQLKENFIVVLISCTFSTSMLDGILKTRIMVKTSMKKWKADKVREYFYIFFFKICGYRVDA